MIQVAAMAIAISVLAAWAGLRLLKREYLPLLKELERTKQAREQDGAGITEEVEGE